MEKLETLEAVQAKRHWAYLGHVLRRLEGNPHRELMKTFEKMTKRKKGRPRKNIFEEIGERIRRRGLKVEELVQAAGNHQEWRRGEDLIRRGARINQRWPPDEDCLPSFESHL